MADTLTEIQSQLRQRLDELRPLVDEYRELEHAAAALSASTDSQPKARRGLQSHGPKRTSRQATRAPRGANKKKVFSVISERPGVSVAEIAALTRLAKPVIYNTTRSGVDQRQLEPVDLGGGRKGFRLAADGEAPA